MYILQWNVSTNKIQQVASQSVICATLTLCGKVSFYTYCWKVLDTIRIRNNDAILQKYTDIKCIYSPIVI